jgi:hypothetical protein
MGQTARDRGRRAWLTRHSRETEAMRILDRLLPPPLSREQESPGAPCIHGMLSPHWDDPDTIGQVFEANRFSCDSCGEEFSPTETIGLRLNALRRLHSSGEPSSSN